MLHIHASRARSRSWILMAGPMSPRLRCRRTCTAEPGTQAPCPCRQAAHVQREAGPAPLRALLGSQPGDPVLRALPCQVLLFSPADDAKARCRGSLKLALLGQTAQVQAGWRLIEGRGIYPSDYLSTAPAVADFDPIAGAYVVCSLIDLAACIDGNRATLEATRPLRGESSSTSSRPLAWLVARSQAHRRGPALLSPPCSGPRLRRSRN